ncbi:response regulator transcription factor [Bacillus aquiflavi]|uniref:Response regulator transcription factor n=1 Tax=Bacillus aquiflavi TaxID=2672567 RepID=A0A6B3VVB3_9BACI|nr:response regulator transcription factor [Bacillus aquiflavi]MBA4535912.1 response regulator transcription factor [Bacillus aquiflavi]NEY80287.1 response regulator transcription factor [Bacillus aquiflavi]UAC47328.1 response regulator transcription factor [Bacillus aquiflavi]
MKKLLLIDDEVRMLDLLSLYLTPYGYHCIKKSSALEAISYLHDQHVDLVLLDVMMPEMNGWEACIEIRQFSDVPIIILTARSEKVDVVKGLKIGADDYVAKPFDEDELLARIDAVLRRKKQSDKIIHFNGLNLNEEAFELHYNDQLILLTPKEFALISLFLKNENKVFTREHLLSSIWGYAVNTEDRTVDSHLRNLREKLRKSGFPIERHLTTVWGIGYKWVTDK